MRSLFEWTVTLMDHENDDLLQYMIILAPDATQAAAMAVGLLLKAKKYTDEDADAFSVVSVFPGYLDESFVGKNGANAIGGGAVLRLASPTPEPKRPLEGMRFYIPANRIYCSRIATAVKQAGSTVVYATDTNCSRTATAVNQDGSTVVYARDTSGHKSRSSNISFIKEVDAVILFTHPDSDTQDKWAELGAALAAEKHVFLLTPIFHSTGVPSWVRDPRVTQITLPHDNWEEAAIQAIVAVLGKGKRNASN